MELLTELGTRTTITSSLKKNTRRWGLFKCPSCSSSIERPLAKGIKNNTCGKAGCRSKGSNSYGSWNKNVSDADKKTKVPYYSTISDYYRKLSKSAICDKWQTLSGFLDDMYDKYVELKSLGVHSITLTSPTNDILNKSNCKWIEDKITNIDFNVNKLDGIYSARMLAQELSIRPYIVTRALGRMPSSFGEYSYEDLKVSPSKTIKTYILTKYQYDRLYDKLVDTARNKSSNVYLVEGNGLVKVGIAVDVNKRLISLKGSSPVPLKLLYSTSSSNALYVEKQLHLKYKEFNTHGEWFNLTEEHVKEIIDYLTPTKK